MIKTKVIAALLALALSASTALAATIEVDTNSRQLILYQDDGIIRTWPIGAPRRGFEWQGTMKITRKEEWPGWRPTAKMRKRHPDLPAYVPGGPDNPLGARALYLGSSLYRIHGSNEPDSIGMAASSGCIRMLNDHVIELYDLVPVGTTVIVY